MSDILRTLSKLFAVFMGWFSTFMIAVVFLYSYFYSSYSFAVNINAYGEAVVELALVPFSLAVTTLGLVYLVRDDFSLRSGVADGG